MFILGVAKFGRLELDTKTKIYVRSTNSLPTRFKFVDGQAWIVRGDDLFRDVRLILCQTSRTAIFYSNICRYTIPVEYSFEPFKLEIDPSITIRRVNIQGRVLFIQPLAGKLSENGRYSFKGINGVLKLDDDGIGSLKNNEMWANFIIVPEAQAFRANDLINLGVFKSDESQLLNQSITKFCPFPHKYVFLCKDDEEIATQREHALVQYKLHRAIAFTINHTLAHNHWKRLGLRDELELAAQVKPLFDEYDRNVQKEAERPNRLVILARDSNRSGAEEQIQADLRYRASYVLTFTNEDEAIAEAATNAKFRMLDQLDEHSFRIQEHYTNRSVIMSMAAQDAQWELIEKLIRKYGTWYAQLLQTHAEDCGIAPSNRYNLHIYQRVYERIISLATDRHSPGNFAVAAKSVATEVSHI